MNSETISTTNVPPLLTVQQLGRLLQLSPRTVWRLRSSGELPEPIKIGKSIRWNGEAIRRWIAAGCPPQETVRGR